MATYGYIRVSTEEQAQGGHSLDAQRAKIEQYAVGFNLGMVGLYVDAGVSAGKPMKERPQGQFLVNGKAGDLQKDDIIIAVKLDRMFRNALDCLQVVAEWDRRGVTARFLDLNVDTGTTMGRFMLQIAAAFAEMERGATRDRTKAVSQHLKATGRVYTSKTPFGWVRDGKALVPVPAEQKVIADIRAKRAEGLSLRGIADELTKRRVPTKTGGAWFAETIRSILGGP